jgi:hypothetical protein
VSVLLVEAAVRPVTSVIPVVWAHRDPVTTGPGQRPLERRVADATESAETCNQERRSFVLGAAQSRRHYWQLPAASKNLAEVETVESAAFDTELQGSVAASASLGAELDAHCHMQFVSSGSNRRTSTAPSPPD